jgi:hypothetical protein
VPQLPTRIIRQHMPLPAGTRFGAYEVINLIGSGDMGEVWFRFSVTNIAPGDLHGSNPEDRFRST